MKKEFLEDKIQNEKKGGGGGGERLVGLYIDDIFLCMHNCLCMCVVCVSICGRVIGDECVSSVCV